MEQDIGQPRIYTTWAIYSMTFLCGPLAGAWALSSNFKTLGNKRASRVVWVITTLILAIITALNVYYIYTDKEVPNYLFPAVYTAIYASIAESYQKKKLEKLRLEQGAVKHSTRRHILVSALGLLALLTLLVVTVELTPDPEGRYATEADKALLRGDYQTAFINMDKLIQTQPDNIRYVVEKGRAQALSGNYYAAIATLKKVIQRDSLYAEAYFIISTCYTQQGKLQESINYLLSAKRVNENLIKNERTLLWDDWKVASVDNQLADQCLGENYYYLNDYENAIKYLSRNTQIPEYRVSAAFYLGLSHIYQENKQEATRYLKIVQDEASQYDPPHFLETVNGLIDSGYLNFQE